VAGPRLLHDCRAIALPENAPCISLREARDRLRVLSSPRGPLLVRIPADVDDPSAVIDGMADFAAAFVLETPDAIAAARARTERPLLLAVDADALANGASQLPSAAANGYVLDAAVRR